MNNEPVAWMYQIHDITGWSWVIDQRLPDYEYRNEKPLYTHPAKTLTDEEIADFEWAIKNVFNFSQSEKVVGLDNVIRAILRKAQEK